jgi:hypothetical protein
MQVCKDLVVSKVTPVKLGLKATKAILVFRVPLGFKVTPDLVD